MTQVTWRAPEELVAAMREAAKRQGRSLNDFITQLARAATEPTWPEDDAERLRERLARAGLLVAAGPPRERPHADRVARARAAAGRGKPLSELVNDER